MQRRIIQGMNWIEELSPSLFSPCEYSNEGSAALCQLGCGFWPFQCHQSQGAGGVPIAQMMPRAKDPKDIHRPTVAGAPWHALHWVTCKINFSGDSPDHTSASLGLQEVKYLDQRSRGAGFEKKSPLIDEEKKRKFIGLFWNPHRLQFSSGFPLSQLTSI